MYIQNFEEYIICSIGEKKIPSQKHIIHDLNITKDELDSLCLNFPLIKSMWKLTDREKVVFFELVNQEQKEILDLERLHYLVAQAQIKSAIRQLNDS